MSVICCVSVQYFVNADIAVFGIYSIIILKEQCC